MTQWSGLGLEQHYAALKALDVPGLLTRVQQMILGRMEQLKMQEGFLKAMADEREPTDQAKDERVTK